MLCYMYDFTHLTLIMTLTSPLHINQLSLCQYKVFRDVISSKMINISVRYIGEIISKWGFELENEPIEIDGATRMLACALDTSWLSISSTAAASSTCTALQLKRLEASQVYRLMFRMSAGSLSANWPQFNIARLLSLASIFFALLSSSVMRETIKRHTQRERERRRERAMILVG